MRHSHCKVAEVRSIIKAWLSCWGRLNLIVLASALLFWMSAGANGSTDPVFDVSIPASPLFEALTQLSEQTEADVLFSFELVGGKKSKAINGSYTVLSALETMLQETGLTGGLSENGVITLRVNPLTTNNSEEGSMNHRKGILAGIIGSLLGVTGSHQALAQDSVKDSSQKSMSLEEVVVTAQKREQSINDVGMSITAATAETLANAGIYEVGDLAKITPGMTTSSSLMGTPTITLRGIGFNDFTLGSSPAVSVYVDQVSSPFMELTRGAMLDLERVEVLKGPQGILFGQNSTGGAVNYIAAKPTTKFEAGASASYGSYDEAYVSGFVSGPIIETVGTRLAVTTSQGGDWQENYTRSESHGEKDFIAARLLVVWQIFDKASLLFNLNGWRDKSDSIIPQFQGARLQRLGLNGGNAVQQEQYDRGQAILALPTAPDDAQAANWGTANDNAHSDDAMQFSVRADIELSDRLLLTSITSYDDFSRSFSIDRDGTELDLIDIRKNDGQIEDFVQEIRLAANYDTYHWMIGANYLKASTDDSSTIGIGDATNTAVPTNALVGDWDSAVQYGNHEIEEYAVFVNTDFQIADPLTLLAGLRYTDSTKDYEGCTTGDASITALQSLISTGFANPFAIAPGDCVTLDPNNAFAPILVKNTLDEDNVSWRLGLDYRLNEDLLIYATVSQGFKSGSFPLLSAPSSIQLEPTTQEQVVAYEAGFKWTLETAPVQLNGALFYYDYSDKQVRGNILALPFGVLEKLVNVPESRVQGAEFQLMAMPIEGLTFNFSSTYLDTEVDEYVGLNSNGVTEDLSGSIIPFTPSWQLVSDAEYRFAATDYLDIFVGGSATHNSRTNSNLGEPENGTIREFTVLDLRAGIAANDGTWTVSAYGRNVTDEYYWSNAFASQDVEVRFAAKPVTYGIKVDYHFQ